MTEYKLVRSKRKTITICVKKDGSVHIKAPLHASTEFIQHLVNSKQEWIDEKSNHMLQRAADRKKFCVTQGDTLTLLGKEYPVVFGETVSFLGNKFTIPDLPFCIIKPQLIACYQQLAEQIVEQKVNYFSNKTGFVPTAIKIGKSNSAWGVCTSKNSLNFTWKLVMAENDVIDYVVVHELCHIKEHNHSQQFWRLVQKFIPDYQQKRCKLKLLQQKLGREDWN